MRENDEIQAGIADMVQAVDGEMVRQSYLVRVLGAFYAAVWRHAPSPEIVDLIVADFLKAVREINRDEENRH